MVFTIYGRGGHLGHVTQISRSPTHGCSTYKFSLIDQAVSEKTILWKLWTTDDGRTDAGLIGILYAHIVSLRLR